MSSIDRVLEGQQKDQLHSEADTMIFLVESVLCYKVKDTYCNDMNTRLDVRPINPDPIRIRQIDFDGLSSVLAGQKIRVRIPRCDESGAYVKEGLVHGPPRPYMDRESAVQIELLSENCRDMKVLRTERSRDYSSY